jgi:DNA polymerase-1
MTKKDNKRLIIVDISSFIFRAFFAIRPMTTPKGEPVNAVYGVLTMLTKLINSYQPSHIVLARDTSGGSFRNEIYPEYKANRGPAPEDLVPQFAMINKLIEVMGIPNKAMPGFEADDLIGSMAVQYKDSFDEVYIASGDKDLMQFVDDKVKMLDTMKDKVYGKDEVKEKMGVWPEQVMDYLSLLGDSSDNIPGVKGIGAKGAAKLLEDFPTLDEVIANIDKLTNKRAKTALEKGIESAYLSKKLVAIVQDLDLGLEPKDLKYSLEPNDDFLSYLDELNFQSLKKKLKNNSAGIVEKPNTFVKFETVKDQKKWDGVKRLIETHDSLFIDCIFRDESYHTLTPFCFGLSVGESNFVIYPEELKSFSELMREVFAVESILIVSNNLKPIFCAAFAMGIDIKNPVFDSSQAHFVLDPDKKHGLGTIVEEFLREKVITIKELLKESLEQEQSVRNFEYALSRRVYFGIRVYPWLMKALKERELEDIYYKMDLPLINTLAKMEMRGINLDIDFYKTVEDDFQSQVDAIDAEVQKIAGDTVNLKSPKQVGVLLFEKLELPIIKKTKTGASTDSSVLEKLAAMGESEIPAMIIKFREIDKLLSTYVKTLPKLVDNAGKIHSHFNQNIAATGRLSSDNPNLQNIPIRSENGRKLRKGFVPKEGHVLLGADYSQVELRILAHLSGDEVMVKAFNNSEDIHAQTASEIMGIDLKDVTSEQRSQAKAVNFGLMYGQGAFGLAEQLGISRTDAKNYITTYFERFHKVKGYLDSLREECEEKGYTETILGRKRTLKDINSSNRMMKSMAERMAINTPIQGTAADIIKQAMMDIDTALVEGGYKSQMLLQVHDELIFEVPEDEVEKMKKLVREKMENAVDLKVPLKVDMGIGSNWYELK